MNTYERPINKRTHETADISDSEKIDDEWISASKTRNSALDDQCLDYFEMYNISDINDQPKKKQKTDNVKTHDMNKDPMDATNFTDYILHSGVIFEEKIVKQMQEKFDDDFIKIGESYEAIYERKFKETLCAMIRGVPIIYQGVVRNPKKILCIGDEKTFGSVDLIVRSDWINKIVTHKMLDDIEISIPAPKIKKEYHYCVVDIKWTKLHFNVNRQTLRNNINVKPFKTQLAVYNEALGYMQGYTPSSAYILGNGWICEKNRKKNKIITKSNDPFDRLGRIDFTSFDKDYTEKASDAVRWIRKLRKQTNFTHDPPNQIELYPNMNNTMDGKHHHVKEQISEKYHEITQLWNCGVKEREIAFDNGVKGWNHKLFNAGLIGLRPGKKQKIIDAIVTLNRDRQDLMYPTKIENNENEWQNNKLVSFYVDFETIQENLIGDVNIIGDYIFMIGVGHIDDGKFTYTNFTASNLTLKTEKEIIEAFLDLIKNISHEKDAILFHWGQHERNVFSRAIRRHGDIWEMPNFVDFCKIMTDEPILIRGTYDFGLKTVAKSMYKHNMIKTIWGDDLHDGVSAMFLGWKEYKKNTPDVRQSQIMQKIIEYNKIDCQTMYEIIDYLRHKGTIYTNIGVV
jgi:hypothetical protein